MVSDTLKLPGIYNPTEIGSELFEYTVYNILIPEINKSFDVTPKHLPKILISDRHLTSAYDRNEITIYLHPDMLSLDVIAEEYTHFLRDHVQDKDLDMSESTIEFFGMLGRLVAHDALKDTKYAKLFRKGYDQSVNDIDLSLVENIANNMSSKEKQQLSIIPNDNPVSYLENGLNYVDALSMIRETEIKEFVRLKEILSDSDLISKGNIEDTLQKVFSVAQYLKDENERLDSKVKSIKELIEDKKASEKQLLLEGEKSTFKPGTLIHSAITEKNNAKKEISIKENRELVKQLDEQMTLLTQKMNANKAMYDKLDITQKDARTRMEELNNDLFESGDTPKKSIEDSERFINHMTEFLKKDSVMSRLTKLKQTYDTGDPGEIGDQHAALIKSVEEEIKTCTSIYEVESGVLNAFRDLVNTVKDPLNNMFSLNSHAMTIMPNRMDSLLASGKAHKKGYDAALEAYSSIQISEIIQTSEGMIAEKYINEKKAAALLQLPGTSAEAVVNG